MLFASTTKGFLCLAVVTGLANTAHATHQDARGQSYCDATFPPDDTTTAVTGFDDVAPGVYGFDTLANCEAVFGNDCANTSPSGREIGLHAYYDTCGFTLGSDKSADDAKVCLLPTPAPTPAPCAKNQYVSGNNTCAACPAGKYNDAGDVISDGSTTCKAPTASWMDLGWRGADCANPDSSAVAGVT